MTFRELAIVHGYPVMVAVIEASFPNLRPQEVEEELDHLAEECAQTIGVATSGLRWVARVQLLDDANDLPVWSVEESNTVDLERGGELNIGWGNGFIVGWDSLESTIHRDVLEGLIHAQGIWCEIADLSRSVHDTVLVAYAQRRGVSAHTSMRALVQLNSELQLHTLAWSDLSRETAIRRRSVFNTTLASWDYGAVRDRVGADIAGATEHLQLIERLADSRYQRVVEIVLLALTVVSALGLVIGLIELSHTIVDAPGYSHRGSSLLELLRAADADYLVITSGLVLLALLVFLISFRRLFGSAGK